MGNSLLTHCQLDRSQAQQYQKFGRATKELTRVKISSYNNDGYYNDNENNKTWGQFPRARH
jgi:hypothetical protein